MTFSEKIKQEVSHTNYQQESKKAILSSFFTNVLQYSITSTGMHWEIKSQFPFVIRMIDNLLGEFYKLEKVVSYTEINNFNKRRTYKLSISKADFDFITEDLKIYDYSDEIWVSDGQKRSYLLGAFLSGGSISSIDKPTYHLEIRSLNVYYLRFVQKLLSNFNISISILKRNKNYVLYVKRASQVSDFLKIIGAYNCMQELEDKIISRDFNNNIHRLNNLDISNIKKSTEANIAQVKMINEIKDSPEFEKQSKKFISFCNLRLENADLSLKDLKDLFEKTTKQKITRTGLNHYVIKLKQLYKSLTK